MEGACAYALEVLSNVMSVQDWPTFLKNLVLPSDYYSSSICSKVRFVENFELSDATTQFPVLKSTMSRPFFVNLSPHVYYSLLNITMHGSETRPLKLKR